MTIEERVIEEATNLKKYATPEELDKLTLERLNPANVFNCIYGQMTGSCNSARALELIQKCCPKAYQNSESDKLVSTDCDYPNSRIFYYFWSPIEKFTYNIRYNLYDRNKIVILIRFLKGQRKTIKFKKHVTIQTICRSGKKTI